MPKIFGPTKNDMTHCQALFARIDCITLGSDNQRRSIHTLLWGLGTFLVDKYGSWVLIDLGSGTATTLNLMKQRLAYAKMLRWTKWIMYPALVGVTQMLGPIFPVQRCAIYDIGFTRTAVYLLNEQPANYNQLMFFDFAAGLCKNDARYLQLPGTMFDWNLPPKFRTYFWKGRGPRGQRFWEQPRDQFNTSSIFAVSRVAIVWSLCALSIALWQNTSPNEQTICLLNFDLNCPETFHVVVSWWCKDIWMKKNRQLYDNCPSMFWQWQTL